MVQRFPAAVIPGERDEELVPEPRSAAFLQVVESGFYEPRMTDEQLAKAVPMQAADHRQFTGVYADSGFLSLEPWGEALETLGYDPQTHPVGTFSEYDKTLNAGGEALLPARMVTDVTVNPGFRRRGILKHMMTSAISRAVSEGVPVMALTASEGAIYGRFGYGPATRAQTVEVNVSGAGDNFGLRPEPSGRVFPVDPYRLDEVIDATFAAHHAATRGSVERHGGYREFSTARWNPEDISTAWTKARAVVHVTEEGEIGGYAIFSFDGWEKSPKTMSVRDLVTVDEVSTRELVRHLAQMDVVERISFPRGLGLDEPLGWALTNHRAMKITGEHDVLWLRILDVPAALAARAWGADGEFRLTVQDSLGVAAGSWQVRINNGQAQLGAAAEVDEARVDAVPHLHLDAETLASLYLGDVSVQSLLLASRVAVDGDVKALSNLIDLPTRPWCATYF